MQPHPFTIKSQCALPLEQLYTHIQHALTLGLPVVEEAPAHDGVAVMVGSGPSVVDQLPAIREERAKGRPIVAIKGAHDWLIEHGIVPDYACCIDPGDTQWKYFLRRYRFVKYLIASQCHASMFEHLSGCNVSIFHCYITPGQSVPPHGTPLIVGGTTTGLRALTLLYSMGYREFELYGYDSCVSRGQVRVGMNLAVENEEVRHEIVVDGKTFLCTPGLTVQAKEFQLLYDFLPDVVLHPHGDGLVQTIIRRRASRPLRTVSFLHHGGPSWASYRYRCAMPAELLGASINDLTADVLIVSKPEALTIIEVKQALGRRQSVIADFCDDHFDQPHYRELLRLADAVTCSTEVIKRMIEGEFRLEATVIPEPYEFPEVVPHCHGSKLLWFGRQPNLAPSRLDRFIYDDLHMVSDAFGVIPWSHETMLKEFAWADIVLMPATAAYKSANRTVEAIRQGCFVVAEPHPSLTNIPGIWIGDLKEGIEWAASHQQEANDRIRVSQTYISQTFAPSTVASAWSRVIRECPSTWDQVVAPGPIGSMSISRTPMSVAT